MDKKKTLLGLLLVLSLISIASGQPTAGGGGGGDMIFDAVNGLVAGEVNSWMDLFLVVIIPLLGVYGITRYLTGKALEMAEDQFQNNDYGSTELGSTEKKMAQFISIAIAAPTVMFFGGVIPYFSLLLAIIGILWFGWQFIGGGLSSRWRSEGGGAETDNSSILRSAGGKAKDVASWARGKGSQGISKLGDMNDKRKEDTAGRQAAAELHEKLREFNEADKQLEQVMERDYGEIRNALIEDQKAVQLAQDEEEKLEKILQYSEKFEGQLLGKGQYKGIIPQLKKGFRKQNQIDGVALLQGSSQNSEVVYAPSLNQLQTEAEEIRDHVKSLVEEAQEEDSLIDDESSTTIQDIQELVETHEIIDMLARAGNALEKEDHQLEKIARDVRDQELQEEIERDEQLEQQLAQQLAQIEQHEEQVLKTLREADEFLGRIVKLDQQEIQELRTELQEDGKIESSLQKLETELDKYNSRDGSSVNQYQQVMSKIENIRSIFNEMDENLKKLGNMKSQEEHEIEEVHQKVKSAIQKIEGESTTEKIMNMRS